MAKPNELLFSLQRLVSDLSLVDRNHHVIDSERAENDIEHSFSVALLCWFICHENHLKLDMNRIFKYSLVHDFAERYAGDINTFAGNADRRRKVKLEEASLRRLSKEFAGFEDLVKSMNDYQSLVDDESLFVWTVDKMQPIILSYMDAWRPHRKIGISYDKFWEIHHGQLQKGSPYCKEIFNTLLEYSKTKYYDQPATKIT